MLKMIKEMFKKKQEETPREEHLEETVAQEEAAADESMRDENVEPTAEEIREEQLEETRNEPSGSPEEEPEEATETEEGEEEAEGAEEPVTEVEAAYCLGAGIDRETLTKAKAVLKELTGGTKTGGFNPSALQLAIRLLNYDRNLEEARRHGYEAGKAEQIASAFSGKRARAEEVASIPRLRGAKDIGNGPENSIFDVARGAL